MIDIIIFGLMIIVAIWIGMKIEIYLLSTRWIKANLKRPYEKQMEQLKVPEDWK